MRRTFAVTHSRDRNGQPIVSIDSGFPGLYATLANPTQHGEAVEVVGIRISTDGFGSYIADSAMGIGAAMPGEVHEPLMTVAQHQRILAASVPAGCKVVPVDLLSGVLEYCDQLLGELDSMYDYAGSTGDDIQHDDADYAQLRALLASAEGVKS